MRISLILVIINMNQFVYHMRQMNVTCLVNQIIQQILKRKGYWQLC